MLCCELIFFLHIKIPILLEQCTLLSNSVHKTQIHQTYYFCLKVPQPFRSFLREPKHNFARSKFCGRRNSAINLQPQYQKAKMVVIWCTPAFQCSPFEAISRNRAAVVCVCIIQGCYYLASKSYIFG